ncbi:MAG: DegT/DnrJ/EryC1/StrS family aminotransferase [Bacteroidetes bacterium]|nr:DegT/DnrJ/EryC1/StrS family aminotransferase [Bacteroidota bacterium]MBU1113687.1 DegT/DnrJ/EryC1/StrS family aminotransferase [Bacteroidota bacterium]MBU1799094.1 DegT/DnrJ/EryC1/StrS family aminotransferase [Bacteroidota bacterium]
MIDLRSDTVTKPSLEMRKVMANAEVGDDVYKEDPTTNRLQKYCAELFEKEDALYVPSGVMGNQLCLNALTQPGDEVICEKNAHIFQYESGSPAMLSGLSMNLIEGENGVITPTQVEQAIRPTSAYYMPRTRVIEIENTHNVAGGVVHPIENIKALRTLADKHNLKLHLDGARLWNASIASGISVAEYSSYFDTVSVCLSKGLGAPVGSVILGEKGIIEEAFRMRKAWGGGMRQIGIIAAAGLFAIENNFNRLEKDHENAKMLANGLSQIEGVEVDLSLVQTNILMFKPTKMDVESVIAKSKEKGLLLGAGGLGVVRAVTHLDISSDDINKAIQILSEVFNG